MTKAKGGLARRSAGLVMISAMLFTTSAGVALPPVTAAADLLAMIRARSPGLREVGVLANKKPRLAPPVEASGVPGSGLSAGGIGSPRWAPTPESAMPPAEPGAPPAEGVSALGTPGTDSFGASDTVMPGFAPNPIVPGSGPGGIFPVTTSTPPGGGGGVVVPPPPPPPPPPSTSPVPEPTGWLLMLLSFTLLGAQLRRGRPAFARLR